MAITYRPYRASDKKALMQATAALQDHLVSLDTSDTLTRTSRYGRLYLDYVLKDVKKTNGKIIVACDNKNIIGFVAGSTHKPTKFEKTYTKRRLMGWVHLLYVDESYRGQQIGKKLLAMMESHFHKRKCDYIRLTAAGNYESPYKFYAKQGYTAYAVDMVKPL